jgi:hypothetical protein
MQYFTILEQAKKPYQCCMNIATMGATSRAGTAAVKPALVGTLRLLRPIKQ